MRSAVLLAAACLILAAPARAQLNCDVRVDLRQVAGTEYEFLGDLEADIEEYLNTTRWSEDFFEEEERIGCTFSVTISQAVSLSRFQAQVAVGARRPIYGTGAATSVFQVLDSDWTFDYNRGQALVLDFNQFDSLTSLLDFYAMLILGYDYDTFEELGGADYFQQALDIAELAAGRQAEGWTTFGDDFTRTSLIRQLTSERYAPLRRAHFAYHFGVLDLFLIDRDEAQANAFATLEGLLALFTELNARRYATDVFFTAKASEIVEVLRNSERATEALQILLEMDPPRRSTYEGLLN